MFGKARSGKEYNSIIVNVVLFIIMLSVLALLIVQVAQIIIEAF